MHKGYAMAEFREIVWERDKDTVKAICYGCGSAMTRKHYAFVDSIYRYEKRGGKGWDKRAFKAELYGNIGMYVCTAAKDHWRLIEIALKADCQGKGMGRMLLNRLLLRMKENGVCRLTFRTSMKEAALKWWLDNGASIVGTKGQDFEMELNIN